MSVLDDPADAPRGDDGEAVPAEGTQPAERAVCKCGASRHRHRADLCAKGHVLPGNLYAVKTGENSATFWRLAEPRRKKYRRRFLTDVGISEAQASSACWSAADAAARAKLLAESYWSQIVQRGGASTPSGRRRDLHNAHQEASDRFDRALEQLQKWAPTVTERPTRTTFGGRYVSWLQWLSDERLAQVEAWMADAIAASEAGAPPVSEPTSAPRGLLAAGAPTSPASRPVPDVVEAADPVARRRLELQAAERRLAVLPEPEPDDGW